MEAKVVYTNEHTEIELIVVGDHKIQFGGAGNGYCYAHDSFSCIDNLSAKERVAILTAK